MTDHFRELLFVYRLCIEEICRLTNDYRKLQEITDEYHRKLVELKVLPALPEED